MTVCETCGDEGYTQLLFYCLKCQIVAVHRYCMDGPSTIDDEEISWYCEQCVPRVPEPPESSRKCERVGKTIDRVELRKRARKKWKNCLSLLECKTPENVKDSDVINDTSNFDSQQENSNEKITPPKQVLGDPCENSGLIVLALKSAEPCEKKIDSRKGRCKRGPQIQTKKDLLAWDVVRKARTKKVSVDGDVGNEQVKVKNNEESRDEVDSKLNGEVNDTSNSQTTKHSEEVVEEVKVRVDNHEGEDVGSCCTIRKPCSSRTKKKKKRSLVIEMEYSDDDDDDDDRDDDDVDVLSPLKLSDDAEMLCTSSSKRPVELGSDHHVSSTKVADHKLAPSAPLNLAAGVPYPPCTSQIVDRVPSQPVIDVIWRGGCVISNNIDPTSFKLEAHVSNKASPAVYGAAIALPKVIDFEIISKRFAWPKSFKESPPTGEIIGLYFFPVGERDEVFYQNLVVKMVDRQLMLMSQINSLELLVFCSLELPEEERRFQRKYYLWGVFRSKQETSSSMAPSTTQVSNSYLPFPTGISRDDSYQNPRDSNHTTLKRFPKSPNPDDLNHPKRSSSSQIDKDQPYGSHKRRYHRPETDGYEYDARKTSSYQFEERRRNYRVRGRDAKTFRTVQNDSYRSRGHYRHYRGRERYD